MLNWIWNIDKTLLININDIRFFSISYADKSFDKHYGKWKIAAHIISGVEMIGYYNSKDEAIEFLNQIASGRGNGK